MESLILEDLSDKLAKEKTGDWLDDLKDYFKKLGFYREPPTPSLLREAQEVYHKLDWQAPVDDDGNLLPCPPTRLKEEMIDEDVLDELDTHALETPSLYLAHRVSTLVDFLLQPAESDVDKARVLTRWLARCLDDDYVRDMPRTTWSHSDAVSIYLWKLRRKEMDYDELFHVLCKYAGLKCYAVEGCVRNTIKYEIGEDFREQRKTWTVVLLDGEWRLLDVRWICEAAYGVLKNNWRLIEDEKGKVSNRRAVRENRGSFKTHVRFRDYYFLTDPEMFIYDHFPTNEKFQLLARPLSYTEAKNAASLRSDFFRHGLFLKSHPENIVVCADGKITFTIGMRDKKSMAFVYKLYRSKTNKEASDSTKNTLDRYVFLERDMEEWEIRATIRCPSTGRFLFELHGSETKETHHALLVTYVIECTGISYDCKPLPPNMRQEWGPGEDTKDMGMVPLTHKKGEIDAEDGDAEIKFDLQKDLEFRHDLIRGEKDEPVSSRHILHTVENGQMAINLRLPEPGEYSLNVLAKEKHKKTRFAPACSYLVSCQDEPIQSKPFPDIEEGSHIGPNENFTKLGFSEEDPWPSFINNLVTGEFRMHIKRPPGHYVMARLVYEEGLKSEAYDNYVMCDTQDDTVTITCIFPKHGSFKLTLFTRKPVSGEEVPIYVKIIDVVLPTLTGMPSPITFQAPDWCNGYRLKAPRNYYLLANENQKISLAMPEARTIVVKDHPECRLTQTDGGFWEGYLKTGPPGEIVEILALDKRSDDKNKMFTYEVVSKEDSLQIEMKQEQLFQKALDELKTLEEEKHTRLTQRMMQAIKERNRSKLQKCLARMKEANNDKMAMDIATGQAVLTELMVEEEKIIARKELRKATRAAHRPSLEAAIGKFQHLELEEEDNDLTSAKEILGKLGGYVEPTEDLNRTKDAAQQTAVTPPPITPIKQPYEEMAPIRLTRNSPGLHIYVTQDDQLPRLDFSSVDTSTPREATTEDVTPKSVLELTKAMKVPSSYSSIQGDDDDELDGTGDFSFKAAEEALKEIELEENMVKVKDMVRNNMRSASRLREVETLQHAIDDFKRLKLDERDGDLSFAEDQLENMSCSRDAMRSHKSWQKRTMDVFKRYWKNMKERSNMADESLNDEIDHEIQRLRHINTMCRKMAKAAKSIGRNWNALIDSEQSFHEILSEQPELNGSLTEEFGNTTLIQQEVMTAEEGMKAAFEELAASLDTLCASMMTKSETSARELETARLEMERDNIFAAPSSTSSLHNDSGFSSNGKGFSDRERAHQLAMKTSFFALRNSILEEIRNGNEMVEEEIRRKLAGLQKKMSEFHGGSTPRNDKNDSFKDFMSAWKT